MNSPMPWVKLYTEMLDDTKVLRLTDVCRWRFVQLILMAGECDAEGLLATTTGPMSLDDIARRLRVPAYMFSKQMNSLMNVGLAEYTPAGYRLVKFSERQGRKQSEKREQWREAQQRTRKPAATGPAWANDESTTSEVVANDERTRSELVANSMPENGKKPAQTQPVINDGADRVEKRRVEKSRVEIGADAPTPPLVLSDAAKEYFSIFKRKRWANDEQRGQFEHTEAEVGAAAMLRAVKWGGANNIARVPAICTTAKKMATGPKSSALPSKAGNGGGPWAARPSTNGGGK